MRRVKSVVLFSLCCLQLLVCREGFAEIQAPSPSIATPCDDFATNYLQNPWDMSDTADVNNFFPEADIFSISNASIGNGVFSGTTTSTASLFYLLSPAIGHPWGSHENLPHFGEKFPFDTSKYKYLTVRMYTDVTDSVGLRILWNKGNSYTSERTGTQGGAIPTSTGWHTYKVDLSQIALGSDTAATPWTSGGITGLALIPSATSGANFKIDYVRLDDTSTCQNQSVSFPYTASSSGNNRLVNIYLDDDNNPFNGYVYKLVEGASATSGGTATLSNVVGLAPGSYKALSLTDGDLATIKLTNPWDMSDSSDLTASSATNPSFSNGSYIGSTGSASAEIYPKLPTGGIPAATFSKLSLKLSRSNTSSPIRIIYSSSGSFVDLYPSTNDPDHDDVYVADLSQQSSWTGQITTFIVQILGANVSFNLDFISLRESGYVTSLSQDQILSSNVSVGSTPLVIDTPPTVQIESPRLNSGERFAAWDMASGDLKVFTNLIGGTDASYPAETNTCYLPDVRVINGLRGNFFKGTNAAPSDDPVQYSLYPVDEKTALTFSAATYHNLCFKLFIDYPFILTALDGSMARTVWKEVGAPDYESSGAFIVGYDGWSTTKWYEFCGDLSTLESDRVVGSSTYNGTISEFRVDSHEIRSTAPYYFDYIRVSKDAESTNGKYLVTYKLVDPDDSDATVSFYLNSSKSTSGGTLVASNLPSTKRSVLIDTSAVPNGTYYLYSVASDGTYQNSALATGKLVVNNTGSSTTNNPVLSIEAPTANATYCNTVQVKGYAVQPDKLIDVGAVEVYIDGVLEDLIHPDLFNQKALDAYPLLASSNTGFDESYDLSRYGNGSHTLQVKAISFDGGSSTESFTIFQGSSNCASTVTDPSPSGTPISIDATAPTATPTPKPRDALEAPKISKLSLTAAGALAATIGGLKSSDTSCSIELYGGSQNATNYLTKFTPKAAEVKGGLKLKGSKVSSSKLKSFKFGARRVCGSDTSSISSKSVKFPKSTQNALKTEAQLLKALKKVTRGS